MDEDVIYLDIETKYLMTDFEGGWKKEENYKNIGIAELGTLYNGQYQTYEEENIEDLIFELIVNADKIVGHNIIQFDARVLKHYIDKEAMKIFNSKLFDTMLEFDKFTGDAGWVSLNDICTRNFGLSKTEASIDVPKMWREGHKEQVKEYLRNDLLMTERFYLAGKTGQNFKYNHKVYGVSKGEREVYVKW
jgi:hypothetical protein